MGFKAEEFIKEKLKEIKERVGRKRAVVATSGGVDSTTCALLAHKVLGEQLKVIFIDDGLMREGEAKRVVNEFRTWGIEVEVVEASEEFFKALRGIEDPEEKRKAFRNTFYKVLGRVVKEGGADYLIQGTIAADIVETKEGIKTQHNVLEQIGINPKEYGFQIIEPLKEIYKHEVREVAKELGLPKRIYERMPFPGPGLATRIVGEVTPERVAIVRKATEIVEKELKSLRSFQALAVLLKDKATGIVEGKRVLGNIIAVRCVESKDALTATVTRVPWEILTRIQKRITTEIPSVTKVLFDLTPKPPSTIEYI